MDTTHQILLWSAAGLGALGGLLLAVRGAEASPVPPPPQVPAGLGLEPYRGNPTDGAIPSGGTRPHRTPSTLRYTAKHLPPTTDRCTFVRMVVALGQELGLSHRASELFTAHVARETGWGRSTWNYNFGNIKQHGQTPWHRLNDGEPYVSYPTARDGLAANIALVRDKPRYATPWRMLTEGNPNWYGELGVAGYYENADPRGAAQREYNSILRRVEGCR